MTTDSLALPAPVMTLSEMVNVLTPKFGSPKIGKVRHMFRFEYHSRWYWLVIVSDRISIFDFVLNFDVPGKGYVLNALNLYSRWKLREKLGPLYQDDLVAFGQGMDRYFPTALLNDKRLMQELYRRAIIVEDMRMIEYEGVDRICLAGSGLTHYEKTLEQNGGVFGEVCGHQLPPGLLNGDKLPNHILTPTTKAESGHDEPRPIQEVRRKHPGFEEFVLMIGQALNDIAAEVGLIRADGKQEIGINSRGGMALCDEAGTPDANRYWDATAYAERKPGKPPPGLDKEPVRDEGRRLGINDLDPEKSEDREKVAKIGFPSEVISATTYRFLALLTRFTGQSLVDFWREKMNIPVWRN